MLEKATEEEIKRTKTEAEKQEAADSKNSEGKKEKLTAELNELKAKHDNLTSEHREEEQTLRRVSMLSFSARKVDNRSLQVLLRMCVLKEIMFTVYHVEL